MLKLSEAAEVKLSGSNFAAGNRLLGFGGDWDDRHLIETAVETEFMYHSLSWIVESPSGR